MRERLIMKDDDAETTMRVLARYALPLFSLGFAIATLIAVSVR